MPLGVAVPFLWQMYDFLRMHGNASCIGGGYQICDKFKTSWECMEMHHALGVGLPYLWHLKFVRLPENAWKCIMHWGWASHICDISILRLPENAWKCIMHWGWASHICDISILRLPENAWKCIMHSGWGSHICDISNLRLPENAWKCIMHSG